MNITGNPRQEPAPATLDPALASRLGGIIVRLRNYVLIEGLAWVIGFLFFGAVAQFVFDYGTRGLQRSMRVTLLLVIVAGAGWLVWRRLLAPLRLRIGLAEVALLVERRYPDLASILISAVRFAAGETGPSASNSPTLANSVIGRAGRRVQSLDFGVVLNPLRARWSLVALMGMTVCVSAAALGAPEMTGLWFTRNVLLKDVAWPQKTHLVVEAEDGVLIGPRGDDLVVQAYAQGVQPREVEIVFEDVSGQQGREAMVTVGSAGSYRYRYTFKNAQEDFEFYLEGGDDQTEVFQARLLDRPRVEQSNMRIVPPAYTRLQPSTLGDGQRAAQALPGSRVTIHVRTNKPVTRATLMAGRDAVCDAAPKGDGYEAAFQPIETQSYHFALLDEAGLENRRPAAFSIRMLRDDPPRVRMKLPGVGDMITPEAILPIELDFADTYGLAEVQLIYRITREEASEDSIPLEGFRPHITTFTTSLSWSVASVAPQPGQRVTLEAGATDFDTVSGPHSAESPDLTLRVVTRDELLAELARREQEYRMAFERLVDAQEQLRGQLLTVMGPKQAKDGTAGLTAILAPLERRERNLAGSVNVIRQQFEQILAELRVNQMDDRDVRERLELQIINPLTQLAKRDMIAAADSVRKWAREGSEAQASLIDSQQVALLSQMRTVLANMIQWEGYHEVVSMLRDIVRLQNQLHSETKEAIVEEAEDLFDD